ncbi:MAG: hypothetical protein MPW15_25460 [Candidatus Manganitrophus sp.]|nr:hypothetical protein [Candidatus Manganitrophus sp.]
MAAGIIVSIGRESKIDLDGVVQLCKAAPEAAFSVAQLFEELFIHGRIGSGRSFRSKIDLPPSFCVSILVKIGGRLQ